MSFKSLNRPLGGATVARPAIFENQENVFLASHYPSYEVLISLEFFIAILSFGTEDQSSII